PHPAPDPAAQKAPQPAARPRVVFSVTLDPAARAEPADGRLRIYLLDPRSEPGRAGSDPADAPFFSDPQPVLGVDVRALQPGGAVVVDDSPAVIAAPIALADLPAGTWRAQAVLRVDRTNSDWRREPGNLYSKVVEFTISAEAAPAPATIALKLTEAVRPAPWPMGAKAELFEIRSELLSKFRGRDVMLRAGVVPPTGLRDGSRYPAVYHVPGFGGSHREALSASRRSAPARGPRAALRESGFAIYLDADGPNGHHLFADSANNGPVGRALVEELIPALEKKYPLFSAPSGRLLRGHSSGGWSVLWLQLNYPDVFGGCWATGPDPVDFRALQLVNIYSDDNFFARSEGGAARDTPSYRQQGSVVKMTIREEATVENALGPDNTSGQQWTSWQAVFGPRNQRGQPAALYNPVTGAIDRAVAEAYRPFDLADRLRRNPEHDGPIWRDRIRLYVGDADSFYLERAAVLLRDDLQRLGYLPDPDQHAGRFEIVKGADHGTVMFGPSGQRIAEDMARALSAAAPAPSPPAPATKDPTP
ncbi:MAG: hypothetical protein IBJ11_12570, partial [Phycisphaerales bacterium]|nr:hypothetical protein [Phycisphaerales bacterium]